MTIVKLYAMTALEGKSDAMRSALGGLAAAVLGLDGCLGVDLLQSASDAHSFRFIEKWESAAAHAAAPFPKEAMTPLKSLLAGPPSVETYDIRLTS